MRKCPKCREKTAKASGYCRDCHRAYEASRYVSRAYREFVRCDGCDAAFVARRPRTRFCSPECRHFVRWWGRRSATVVRRRPAAVECAACGKRFDRKPKAGDKDRKPCCSRRCAQRLGALATNRARWGETAPGTRRAKDLARSARRRARIAAQMVETVDPDVVFERDGWRCHLCGKRIDRSLDGNAPWGPTIDHLIPLADDGPHSYANVKAAHRLCNVRRGARGIVQLALLG